MAVGIDVGLILSYDQAFPVAGIDQPSQQFRDNFGVIKASIENLQSKTIEVTGDVTGTSSIFDSGTSPVSLNLTLPDVITSTSVPLAELTVDSKGRITAITDVSAEYLRTDGTNALTGNLNLNSNNITAVNTINGIDINDINATTSALEASGTGVLVRTGVNTYSTHTIAGITQEINVSNGSGSAPGNINIGLAPNPTIPGLYINLPSASSDPGSPVPGRLYYNDTSNELRYYDGSAWRTLQDTTGAAAGFVAETGDTMTGALIMSGAPIDLQGGADLIMDATGGSQIQGSIGTLLGFIDNGSTSYVQISNGTSNTGANAPRIEPTTTTSGPVDININPVGSGRVRLDGVGWPTMDGSIGQVLTTDGAGQTGWEYVDDLQNAITGSFILRGVTLGTDNYGRFESVGTGDNPTLSVEGLDTNIDLQLEGKGTGTVRIDDLRFPGPGVTGSSGEALVTDGAGNLSFNVPSINQLKDPGSGDVLFDTDISNGTGNYLEAQTNTSGGDVTLTADGTDTNISVSIVGKGTGDVIIDGLTYPNVADPVIDSGNTADALTLDGSGNVIKEKVAGLDAPYLMIATGPVPDFTDERYLVVNTTTGLSFVDNGPNNTVDLAINILNAPPSITVNGSLDQVLMYDADGTGDQHVAVTIDDLVSGSTLAQTAAPEDAPYITLSADPDLSNESVLTAGQMLELNLSSGQVEIEADILGLPLNNTVDNSTDFIPYYDATDGLIKRATVGSIAAAGSAVINSGSNVGTNGQGTFKQISGTTAEFFNIVGNTGLTTTLNTGNDDIEIDLDISTLPSLGATPANTDLVLIYDGSTHQTVTYADLKAESTALRDTDNDTAIEVEETPDDDIVSVYSGLGGSGKQIVAQFQSANTSNDDEHVIFTNAQSEIDITANAASTPDVGFRFSTQGDGNFIIDVSATAQTDIQSTTTFFGQNTTGNNPVIRSRNNNDFTMRAGDSSSQTAGTVFVQGGDGTGQDGGDAILQHGGSNTANPGFIVLYDDNSEVIMSAQGSPNAVNGIFMTNAATGAGPRIETFGNDTNVDLVVAPEGAGLLRADPGYDMSAGPGEAFATKDYVDTEISSASTQNIYETIDADTGTATTASTPSSTLTISGGTDIETTASTDTITVEFVNNTGYITQVLDDPSPQLGGNLDTNGNNITSPAATDISITAGTTGQIVLDGLRWPNSDGTNGQVLTTDGSGNLSFTSIAGGSVQDIYETVTGDTGTTTADSSTDSLAIVGGTNISTTVTTDQVSIAFVDPGYLLNVVNDATPQLGGDLEVNGQSIVSATGSNGDIPITPDGTGQIILDGLNWPTADGTNGQAIVTDGAGNLSFTNVGGSQDVWVTIASDSGSTTSNSPTDVLTVTGGTDISTSISGDTLTINYTGVGGSAQNLYETIGGDTGTTTAASATSQLDIVSGDPKITTAVTVDTVTITTTAIENILEDTTPQLGGNLDVNGFELVSTGGGDITLTPDTTGRVVLDGLSYPDVDGTNGQALITDGAGNLSFANVGGSQNLWSTIASDSGSTTANNPTDLFTIAGGTDISTSISGDTLTINFTGTGGPGTTQNLYETIVGDTGTTVANTATDTLNIVSGDPKISTSVTSDTVTITTTAIENVVDDTTPQLGGNLDVNGNQIVSTAGGDITLAPDTTGRVVIDGLSYPDTDGTNGQVITTDGAGNLSFTTVSGGSSQNLWQTIDADSGSTSANSTTDTLTIAGGTDISTTISGDTLTINFTGTGGGTTQNLYETFTDGTNNTTASSATDTMQVNGDPDIDVTISSDQINIAFINGTGYITSVSGDSNPSLSGDLDVGSNDITTTTTDGDITVIPDGTGSFEVDGVFHTKKQTATLTNNTTAVFYTYGTTNDATIIEYGVARSGDGFKTGQLFVITDGTSVNITDTGSELNTPGVTFTAAIVSGNVEISYTTTNSGNSGTLTWHARQWSI